MKATWYRHKEHWTHPQLRARTLLAMLVFAASVVVSFLSITYATDRSSNSVTDFILSNTPVFDVDLQLIAGTFLLIAFIVYLCLHHPGRSPFVLFSLSAFFFIRSVFTSLTHIAPFPGHITASIDLTTAVSKFLFGFGGDLFFSAHTGVPFLMALLFWQTPWLRNVFLASSVFFGTVVLLGHLHYSIDVLAAFFITYAIYHLCLWLFPNDHTAFLAQK